MLFHKLDKINNLSGKLPPNKGKEGAEKSMLKKALQVLSYNRGFIRCTHCRKKVRFTGFQGLRLQQCQYCQTPLFIPLRISNYWLYKPLGAGGFGSVYKAVSTQNFKTYAMKVLPRDHKNDEDYINHLMFEAKIGSILGNCSHLVKNIEYGMSNDEYFLVNEFVRGERLDHLLQKNGRIPELLAYKLIIQILDTEQYIYKHGFLYRDLKPENIIINDKGHLTLLDYGLCCTVEEAESGQIVTDDFEGSPHFIPPERIIGMPEGQYSEIYSIGMLFYNILCANTYYKPSGGVKRIILQHVKSARLPSVKYNLPHCHQLTNKIIDHMIARAPQERFNSYRTLRKALLSTYQKIRKKHYDEGINNFSQYIASA